MPPNPEILVAARLYPPALADLEREFIVHRLWGAPDPQALIAEVAPRVRAVVTTGLAGLSRERIEALPRLELIACFGTPHGTVDLAAARARGILVTNTPDSISASVADLALGLMLALMRGICSCDRFVRAGRWLEESPPVGREVRGKRCGILGLGRIGREIAARAQAFGMSVSYHGPREKPDVPYRYHADVLALARDSDCLFVACWSSPATRGLVDAGVLDALGPEGFLVNIARGPIVDQAALITALRERRIAGAALDVYWDEPRVPDELLAMDNVVLTPHIGSSTREVREGRRAKLLANLRAYFAGQPVPHPLREAPRA